MTEEIKNETNCKCCECREKLEKALKEFFFKALIVYVGVTLAIITSANLLKPKHPCPMMKPPIGIERQMPPMHYGHMHKGFHKGCPKMNKKHPPINNFVKPEPLPIKK
jgi:hypothetical protein